MGKKYAFLDRDGTVIRERNYLSSAQDVELLPGVATGLRWLQQAGYGLIIISNQSGIGRGYFSEGTLAEIHTALEQALAAAEVHLDAIFYCPHTPQEHCCCRKPETQMVERAAARFHFDPAAAVMVGDKPCDIELGRRCGMKTILVRSGYGYEYELSGLQADHFCDDLTSVADVLLATPKIGGSST